MAKEDNIFKNPQNSLKQLNIESPDSYQGEDFTINNTALLNIPMPFTTMNYRMEFFCFVFAKKAAGTYTTDDVKFNVDPGTVFFINPGHLSSNTWTSMDELYLITFTETYLKTNVHADIFDEFPFLLSELVNPRNFAEQEFKDFEDIYLQISREFNSTSVYKDKIISSLLVALLIKIKDKFWQDYNPIYEGNKSSQIVKTFKINLERHLRELVSRKTDKQLRVGDYATLQNLNESYLSSVIKSKTGKPISTWIADKMVSEAKSLLQKSTFSIKEIAFILGFIEIAHFSTYFKKYTGATPAEFRKSSR